MFGIAKTNQKHKKGKLNYDNRGKSEFFIKQTSQRISYIDIAKGMAIFLMVVGHSYSVHNNLITYIYSFHMPFFFLVTGILYGCRVQISGHLILNLRRRAKTLLLPYMIWGALYMIFLAMFQIIGGSNATDTLLKNGKEFIKLEGGAMWFLPVMFVASIAFLLVYKMKRVGYVIFAILMFIGLFAPENNNPYLEALYKAFVGTGFIAIGFYGRKVFQYRMPGFTCVSLFIIDLILVFANGQVDLLTRVFHNPILYVVVACLGTYVLLSFARLLDGRLGNKKCIGIIEYAGKSTLEILCLHMFIIEILRILDYKIMGNFLPKLGVFEGIIIAPIVYFLLILILLYINQCIAFSFGKNK